MENEKAIYTEVYTVLTRLPRAYTDKIPETVKENIFNKATTDYAYEIDELLPESKAIILALIKNYFGDTNLNEKINKYINFCEEEKAKKYSDKIYNSDELFEDTKSDIEEKQIKCQDLIQHKEKNFFKKIFDKIRTLFTKK